MKVKSKKAMVEVEYWVIKKWWKRRIVRGPFFAKGSFDRLVEREQRGPVGGPVELRLVQVIDKKRIVNRGKAKGVVIE